MSPQVQGIADPPWYEANRVAIARRREARWDLLRWQWQHSSLDRLRYCRLHCSGGAAALYLGPEGSYWSGLLTCGSVWACPVCSAIIRQRRAVIIEDSAVRWMEGEGRFLGLLTLTVRHHQGDGLAGLYRGMAAGWKLLQQSRWWRELGWFGFWRSVEVTYGENGWHPHLHVLLFGEGAPLSAEVVGELSRRWRAAVVKVGMEATTLARGARYDAVTMTEGKVGQYLSKTLDDEGKSWGVGMELARSDVKRAKGGRFSVMGVLEAASNGEAWAGRRWREYEQVTFGRRATESSRLLLRKLGLEDQADEQLVADEVGGEAVATVGAADYRALAWAGWSARVLSKCDEGDGPATVEFIEAVLRVLRVGV